MKHPLLSAAEIRAELAHTEALFADIRAKFTGPGVERGGHERPGVVPIYVKKYGEYTSILYPDVQRFSVESSFSEAQLRYVNAALLALKEGVLGTSGDPALAQRVTSCYLHSTRPHFMAAMLVALEDIIRAVVTRSPQLSHVIDAIFRIAGSEGIRDLVRMYCAHHLEQALAQATASMPDLLAFVDVHDREIVGADGATVQTKYEVWCPGTDLAKAIFRQCEAAAQDLVASHGVTFALSLQEEAALLPVDISRHMTAFVQNAIVPTLRQYGTV